MLASDQIAQVTLVHAPAGFGKTTLLREAFLSCAPDRVAWLSVDTADNDPGRLLFHLLAALGDAQADMLTEVAGLDKIATSTDQAGRLGEVLRRLPDGFCLFVDELDQLTEPVALGVIAQVMRNLPNGCALVLGGRSYPELPFGRLRMHGQFREIGAGELRFTPDEVAQVLGLEMPDMRISRETQEHLYAATEGWIGSVQMAILSARSSRDLDGFLASFSGTNVELAEYLAEDIFARQSQDMQEFLLASAVLEQFSAELCDTILGRDDSAAVLQAMARANMFLSSYDQENTWFRYHNLFRSFLLARSESQSPDRVSQVRRRAARWFAGQDRPSTAISYALASNDLEFAAELIDGAAMEFFYAGRLLTIANWVRPLPDKLRDHHPHIMLAYAWSLIALQQEPETVRGLIDKLEARNDISRELHNEIIYLGPFHAALTDRLGGLDTECLDAMAAGEGVSAFSRGVLWNIACYARLSRQDYRAASEAARAARAAHMECGSAYGLSYAEAFLGRIELAQGRVQSALAHAEATRAVAERAPDEAMTCMCAAHLELRLDYETGRDEAVLEKSAQGAGLVEQLAPPYEVIDHFSVLAELAFDRGDSTAAYRLLNRLRQVGRGRGHARMEAIAWALQAQMAARLGDVAAARDYLDCAAQCEQLLRFDSAILEEAEAVVAMISGQPERARGLINKAEAQARTGGNVLALSRFLVLKVELELQAGEMSEAEATIAEVLALVHREGLLRPVLRAPEAVRQAFSRFATSHRLGLNPEILDRVDPAGARRNQSPYRQELPLEALSKRELEVLEELSKGLSNQEIARNLSVSLPTVKTHLRNINSKLVASNRTEAVMTARRLGLVSDT